MSCFDELFRVAVALSRGRVCLGDAWSVGPWTPAVPDGFAFAVKDLQGAPHFLARDAFEAAAFYLDPEVADQGPIEQPDPADVERWRLASDADRIELHVENMRWAAEQRRKHLARVAAQGGAE